MNGNYMPNCKKAFKSKDEGWILPIFLKQVRNYLIFDDGNCNYSIEVGIKDNVDDIA